MKQFFSKLKKVPTKNYSCNVVKLLKLPLMAIRVYLGYYRGALWSECLLAIRAALRKINKKAILSCKQNAWRSFCEQDEI